MDKAGNVYHWGTLWILLSVLQVLQVNGRQWGQYWPVSRATADQVPSEWVSYTTGWLTTPPRTTTYVFNIAFCCVKTTFITLSILSLTRLGELMANSEFIHFATNYSWRRQVPPTVSACKWFHSARHKSNNLSSADSINFSGWCFVLLCCPIC